MKMLIKGGKKKDNQMSNGKIINQSLRYFRKKKYEMIKVGVIKEQLNK